METNKESKCERCGRMFGAATWDDDSVKEYKEVLRKTGYKVLCETCTLQLKEEKETKLDFPTLFTQMMPQFKEKSKEKKKNENFK